MASLKARLIAFYLPQFHHIPENDLWWGKGFTEWTNVTKAKSLFRGHKQPHLPADLGFYDLRIPEIREAQAKLAAGYGIEGFCYWHYWFGGKKLLERPFEEVLVSQRPNFPFCLAWANQSWSGIWHGCPDKILIEQTYPGSDDYEKHFYDCLKAFQDPRYIRIDGKPLFLVYKPLEIPKVVDFINQWQGLARQSRLPGIYFIAFGNRQLDPRPLGFDASVVQNITFPRLKGPKTLLERAFQRVTGRSLDHRMNRVLRRPTIYNYADLVLQTPPTLSEYFEQYPIVIPNWDNTPRSKLNGVVLQGSSPELFRKHLKDTFKQVESKLSDKRVVFIKSWNEWAEGNYLEPDQEFGHQYLQVLKEEVIKSEASK